MKDLVRTHIKKCISSIHQSIKEEDTQWKDCLRMK
jgi:hypothetical protein